MTHVPGLSYLMAHPESVSLTFHHAGALAACLGILVLIFLAPQTSQYRRLILGLRITAFIAAVLALAGLSLRISLPSERLSMVALLDLSDSIDSTGKRWEERYVEQLASALAPEDEMTVVRFARDAVVEHAETSDSTSDNTFPGSGATDIGKAIDTALALFPAERERRIVLLSDGNETRGDSMARLSRAKAAKVAIYAAVPPRIGGSDAAVDKLVVPPLVSDGTVFPIRVVVRNQGLSQPAQVTLTLDGQPLGRESIFLHQGLNSLEIPYRLTTPGNHRIRAEVSLADDTVSGNNFRETGLMVGGKTRVLIVTQRSRTPLALALDRKDIAVTSIKPGELGTHLEALASYHCVIFEEVAAASLDARSLDALERYVRDGGGFVLAAGERTYGDAAFKQTALSRLLPVTLEPRRPPRPEREPLALYLLIDRSNSMGYDIHNRTERSTSRSKLEYAKRAALEVIGQLRDTDLVGVIVFDSQMYQIAPLRALQNNRDILEKDLPRLVPGGGTDFYDALETARKQLVEARVSLAHVMLLTDGDTNQPASEYYPIVDALAKARVSVTAIRIGDDTVNLKLLSDIASRTGGQFYHVENAETLPQLLLKDTGHALAHAPRHDTAFEARLSTGSQLLRGIKVGSLPELHGYAFAKPKPSADVLLHIAARDSKDPLLAVWQYGLGRVVAFTAGLGDDAETWVSWDGFGKLWSQLVHWTVREQTAWDFAVDVQRNDGRTMLVAHTFGDLDNAVLLARLTLGEKSLEVTLAPEGPRVYSAQLPDLGGGRYPLTLLVRRDARDVDQRDTQIIVPSRDAEPQEEYDATGTNRALLEALSSATGGALDAPVRTVVGRQTGSRSVDAALDWFLVPLAMLCFLGDIAVRRAERQASAA